MIANLDQMLALIDEYALFLGDKGVKFNDGGFPLLEHEVFVDEWPESMVPYKYRNCSLVTDASQTALCFFAPDAQIYPRLEKLLSEIDSYREYHCVVMPDVTVTSDMEPDWQDLIMLLNQLAMAVLAVSGIKVMPNTRCGSPSSARNLLSIPKGVIWASGSLGCAGVGGDADASFIAKVLPLQPAGIAIYGKEDPILEAQLDRMGIPMRRYADVHTRYKSLQ